MYTIEATNTLANLKRYISGGGVVDRKASEAIDMAIRALEVTANPDTVSRQAALDAIFSEPLYESGMKKRDADIVVPAIYEKIEALPPSPSRLIGHWMRMSDLNESEDDRYKCSCCGNVVHHRDKVFLYTYNSFCGACGANNNAKNYAAYMQGGAPQ